MILRILLSVFAIVTALFGIIAFISPTVVIGWYSPVPAGPLAETGFRLAGSLGIGVAVAAWFARTTTDVTLRTWIVRAVTLVNALGCITAFLAASSGAFNGGAWFEVVSYALWTALFVIFGRNSQGF